MSMTPLGGGDDNSGIVAEINITPLTDIFLVLLIIFMITSSAMVESGGKVNLPKAVATQSESCGTTVTLTPKREIFVNQKKVNEEGLEAALQEALKANANYRAFLPGFDCNLAKYYPARKHAGTFVPIDTFQSSYTSWKR